MAQDPQGGRVRGYTLGFIVGFPVGLFCGWLLRRLFWRREGVMKLSRTERLILAGIVAFLLLTFYFKG